MIRLMLVVLLVFTAGWPILAFACAGSDSPMEMTPTGEVADRIPVPVLRPPCVDMACCDGHRQTNQSPGVASPGCADCLSQPELGPSMSLACQKECVPEARVSWAPRHSLVPRLTERSAAAVRVQWSPRVIVAAPQSRQVLYASFLI